ncbi:uncharacterized protein [Lepeophtheirus salmonis]|uniref:uncharacterized protein n=1 Tax=Lepeophtheirus salmonis TaxID=72036 RepID=UPI001AE31A8A|nr:uncharacterized protein LOC121114385 [Lepeophtheirus salmonis]
MFSFKSLLVISCFIMVFSSSDAGVIDDDDHVSPEELQDYINQLQDYIQIKEQASKRGRFCLRRDMTCPNLPNGKDFCCSGSQCSCNLFGQNCRCSTIGLFQRLGKR